MRVLNWGIMGTGRIADRFARGLATTDDAAKCAVGSRAKERAQDFAMKFGFARAHGSYEELLSNSSVEAVYIALPNHLHCEWAVRAAKAGKHVLLEKPATITAAELEKVLATAKEHDVFFAEAFMYRFHPRIAALKEILDSGRIGEVRMIDANFEINIDFAPEDFRRKNEMGGGSLMDLGSYCVSFCRMVAGAEPETVHGVAQIDPGTRVDFHATGVLRFPGGAVGSFACGNQSTETRAEVRIQGSEGDILITDPWGPAEDGAPIVVTTPEQVQTLDVKLGKDLYANEALTVAEHLDARQIPAMNWADSRGQAKVMDSLRADMGLKFDCE
jgi:predicted dehydrogenase